MANLLITGGAGFIGANFVRYWADRHPQDSIVVLDALTYAGNPASLASMDGVSGYRFIEGDICDLDLVRSVLSDHAIDVIVHFAAESHVDRSISGPDIFIRTNVLGTQSLLRAAAEHFPVVRAAGRVPRFHHISTDEVYGSLEPGDPAFTESTPYSPNSPYAASKAASDHLVRAYHHTFGLEVSVSNCSNNYGPLQFPEKLIPLAIINLLSDTPVPVYGDGRNIRDWLYVHDHCRGIEDVLLKGEVGRTYNIGGRCEVANIDLVGKLCDELDAAFRSDPQLRERYPGATAAALGESRSLISFVTDRLGHDRRYAINSGRAERELEFAPSVSFEVGLRRTLRWYLDNADWWLPLRERQT